MSKDRDPLRTDALLRAASVKPLPAKLTMPDESRALPQAGADFAEVPLNQPVAANAGGAGKQAAGCDEAITWKPISPAPTDILADNALEFAAKVDAVLGAGGHTHVGVSFAPDVDKGMVSAVNMTVESAIIRPRWAGGRPSAKDKALIEKVEAFIKAHEERHRDLSRAVMQQAVCDAKGQPVAAAEATLKKAICDLEPSAQEQLDAKEGKLEWVKDATGAVVDFKAVGEQHNYHDAGCDPFKAPPPGEDQGSVK
jgi:hypothetical protein